MRLSGLRRRGLLNSWYITRATEHRVFFLQRSLLAIVELHISPCCRGRRVDLADRVDGFTDLCLPGESHSWISTIAPILYVVFEFSTGVQGQE